MTIMDERHQADYIRLHGGRETWIDACHAGADAMESIDKPGPSIVARDRAAASVIQTALDEARAEERRKVVEWLLSPHGFDHCGVYYKTVADAIEKGKHHG